MIEISVARDFSVFPGPRFIKQGAYSGESFREKILVKAINTGKPVTVLLDGTRGFGSSWLDEAFGGLIRNHGLERSLILKQLKIISDEDEIYKIEAIDSIQKAEKISA